MAYNKGALAIFILQARLHIQMDVSASANIQLNVTGRWPMRAERDEGRSRGRSRAQGVEYMPRSAGNLLGISRLCYKKCSAKILQRFRVAGALLCSEPDSLTAAVRYTAGRRRPWLSTHVIGCMM
ncbi:hypothetical protein CRV24_002219 [Beauveria bassiana]|nr:hypothetical protein CRV24_002219 [Beauveria bassiana]